MAIDSIEQKLTKFDGGGPVEEAQRGVYVNQLNDTVPFVDVSEIKDGKTYCEEKILAYLGVEDK